jgi:lysyl-tRNA synthetase class 2
MPAPSPWWTPHVHTDRRPFLLGRNRIQAAFRGFFAARDFVEVDTATLQVSPGNEAHLHAFATEAIGHGGARTPLYLHTSPEFACKKLLAAGEARIPASPMSTATVSAAPCTTQNSRCSNGIGPVRATRA